MTIGIISNPYSGKDIRRLVSSAIVSDSSDKLNIIERIIMGAQAFGSVDIVMNPDKGSSAKKVEKRLRSNFDFDAKITMLDYPLLESAFDSARAAEWMNNSDEISCIIILGGDGTNRVVAKKNRKKPIISISTGTNNVYPEQLEGTIVGIAAAILDKNEVNIQDAIRTDKKIEIYRNGELVDIALVDAVLTNDIVIGSKAIWNLDNLELIVVTRCHPASTGFSSILGSHMIVHPDAPYGAVSRVNGAFPLVITAASPGGIVKLPVEKTRKLNIDEKYMIKVLKRSIIALDGEREVIINAGDKIEFIIRNTGPQFVKVGKIIELGLEQDYFSKYQ